MNGYPELSLEQQNILQGLMILRYKNSPLVQGINLSQEEGSVYIQVRRMLRSSPYMLKEVEKYFHETSGLFVVGTYFVPKNGDFGIIFEENSGDKTNVMFTRQFNLSKDISLCALVGRPPVCMLSRAKARLNVYMYYPKQHEFEKPWYQKR